MATPEHRATVLVADDEAILQRLMRRVLERAGFAVEVVGDGDAAVEAVAADPERFAAAVLDVSMPPQGPESTLDRLLAVRADLPVVLTSGADLERDLSDRLRDCGGRFLPKPFPPAALLEALHAATRRGS